MRLRSYAASLALTAVIAALLVAVNAPAVIATHVGSAAHSFIVNTAARPVWVRDVDNARAPYQANAALDFNSDEWRSEDWTYTVPAGRRLVIEGVSGTGRVDVNETVEVVTIRTSAGGSIAAHTLTNVVFLYSTPILRTYGITETVRLYADPGTQVRVNADRNRSSGSYAGWDWVRFDVVLSGYLVNVP